MKNFHSLSKFRAEKIFFGGGGGTDFTLNVLQLEQYNDMKNINGISESEVGMVMEDANDLPQGKKEQR